MSTNIMSGNSSKIGHNIAHCGYCNTTCNHVTKPFLTCMQCSKKVHIKCLKSGGVPGGLIGDVFYKLCCLECSYDSEEILRREKLPWLAVVALALYFLSKKELGSNQGFFHYKHHICDFIDRNYDYLFKVEGQQKFQNKKTKKWIGTVSGTLSHFNPKYFLSGATVVFEPGWWKLTKSDVPPKVIVDEYMNSKEGAKVVPKEVPKFLKSSRSKSLRYMESAASDDSSVNEASLDSQDLDLFDNLSQHGLSISGKDMYSRAYVEPSETLSNFLFEDELDDSSDNIDIDIEGGDMIDVRGCNNEPTPQFLVDHDETRNDDTELWKEQGKTLPSTIKSEPVDLDLDLDPIYADDEDEFVHLSAVKTEPDVVGLESIAESDSEEDSEGETHTPYVAPVQQPKSLFNVRTETANPAHRPWDRADRAKNNASKKRNLIVISEFEESQLFEKLRRTWSSEDLPCSARRLYRKLCVRRLKRQHNLPLFDIDSLDANRPKSKQQRVAVPGDERILDRFQRKRTRRFNEIDPESPFAVRLTGESEPTNFFSPYTQRELKAFIWRDQTSKPPWLALLEELLVASNKRNPDWTPEERWPIDYSYVRPQHIPSVNSLCEEFFYPGIDLSESLTYPDFTCVALYKKLVVGFAFLVPDVGYNETYISFLFVRPEWRRAGIATFMVYHLIQTCMGKDITLHVSAANPAVVLYQKFGFKMEEYVQDFYDKYLPADSKECKHALYLRLSR